MSICSKGLEENESTLKEHLSIRPQESRINAVSFLPGCFQHSYRRLHWQIRHRTTELSRNVKKVAGDSQNVSLSFATGYINNPGDPGDQFYCSRQAACTMSCFSDGDEQAPEAGSWVPEVLKNRSINMHLFQEHPFCFEVSGGVCVKRGRTECQVDINFLR